MDMPDSLHSCLPTQNDWKDATDANTLPPIHVENFLSLGNGKEMYFAFCGAVISDSLACSFVENPPNIELPPVTMMLLYSYFFMSMSHKLMLSLIK